jgi:hypothetical protein
VYIESSTHFHTCPLGSHINTRYRKWPVPLKWKSNLVIWIQSPFPQQCPVVGPYDINNYSSRSPRYREELGVHMKLLIFPVTTNQGEYPCAEIVGGIESPIPSFVRIIFTLPQRLFPLGCYCTEFWYQWKPFHIKKRVYTLGPESLFQRKIYIWMLLRSKHNGGRKEKPVQKVWEVIQEL